MKISEIAQLLEADVLCCQNMTDREVHSACGSDMMSDVLAASKAKDLLLTGLVNLQVVRTADVVDAKCIVFVRSKKPDDTILALAKARGIIVLATEEKMFEACGKLYHAGLREA